MEIFMDLLRKITATRNAQIVHMRNPTMLNNFSKIVYEVSLDQHLKDLSRIVTQAGFKVEFPADWVKPRIEELMKRYTHSDEFNEDQIKKHYARSQAKATEPTSEDLPLPNFRKCHSCNEAEECSMNGCFYDRCGL